MFRITLLNSDLTPTTVTIIFWTPVHMSQGIGATGILIPKNAGYKVVIENLYLKKLDEQTSSKRATTVLSHSKYGLVDIIVPQWIQSMGLGLVADCEVHFHYEKL